MPTAALDLKSIAVTKLKTTLFTSLQPNLDMVLVRMVQDKCACNVKHTLSFVRVQLVLKLNACVSLCVRMCQCVRACFVYMLCPLPPPPRAPGPQVQPDG